MASFPTMQEPSQRDRRARAALERARKIWRDTEYTGPCIVAQIFDLDCAILNSLPGAHFLKWPVLFSVFAIPNQPQE
jgi:hypothetical protein